MRDHQGEAHVDGESMAMIIRIAVAMTMVTNKNRSSNMGLDKESGAGKGEVGFEVCNSGVGFAPGAGGVFAGVLLVFSEGGWWAGGYWIA